MEGATSDQTLGRQQLTLGSVLRDDSVEGRSVSYIVVARRCKVSRREAQLIRDHMGAVTGGKFCREENTVEA